MYDPSEALLQLGLYDYVWGNPSLLQTYNANVQAQKAREEQNAYNMLWKQIEEKKVAAEKAKAEQLAAAEKAKADELARKEKEAKLAGLYKDYNNAAGEQERAYIARQIKTLEGNSDVESEMLNAYDADRAAKQKADRDEALRHSAALREIADIEAKSRKLKKAAQKDALANDVYDINKYPNMNDAERDKLYASLKGIKALDEKVSDAVEGAAASHAGEKTKKQLNDADLLAQANAAIAANSKPSSLTPEIRQKIRELGYTWNGAQWVK